MTKIEYLLYGVMVCILLRPRRGSHFYPENIWHLGCVDPLTIGAAFKAMQLAYDGITYCCDALYGR